MSGTDQVALVVAPGTGAAWTTVDAAEDVTVVDWSGAIDSLAAIERERRPRWTWWNGATARALVDHGLRPSRCWDLAAVHRLLVGGWRADPARVWAWLHDLDPDAAPREAPIDLFHQPVDDDGPLTPDGHLDPGWAGGAWASSLDGLTAWVALLRRAVVRQLERVQASGVETMLQTARAESTAELLCAEIEADGLPLDVAEAERVITALAEPRPADAADALAARRARDARVLRHLPDGSGYDLRKPGDVRSMLRRVGVEVPDTRAWRLEGLRTEHPVVDELLAWRKAERLLTTFGYGWLDEHVDTDGRLRGRWSASDGAAGRMTATAGLHNLPSELRSAVVAEAGHAFVRADLGQVEPRVLAAVSGDRALERATLDDDLYQPVADRLRVERGVAKVAVLGAMYGQTTGHGAAALAGLERAYPVAMGYLRDAADTAQGGHTLRTHGGRTVPMSATAHDGSTERDLRARAAARGRYGRNAMIQGAAAELFKMWAVVTRARTRHLAATIVLCLHDELLLHVPLDRASDAVDAVSSALVEAVRWWAPPTSTARFLADTAVVHRWSDAK